MWLRNAWDVEEGNTSNLQQARCVGRSLDVDTDQSNLKKTHIILMHELQDWLTHVLENAHRADTVDAWLYILQSLDKAPVEAIY